MHPMRRECADQKADCEREHARCSHPRGFSRIIPAADAQPTMVPRMKPHWQRWLSNPRRSAFEAMCEVGSLTFLLFIIAIPLHLALEVTHPVWIVFTWTFLFFVAVTAILAVVWVGLELWDARIVIATALRPLSVPHLKDFTFETLKLVGGALLLVVIGGYFFTFVTIQTQSSSCSSATGSCSRQPLQQFGPACGSWTDF
jgi:hypothetical protein